VKYIYIDSAAIDELINERRYQSIEFEDANIIIDFFRNNKESVQLSASCAALKDADGGFIVCANCSSMDYLIFDLEQIHEFYLLDDSNLLTAIQKILRFAKKIWAGLSPSKNERLLSNNKAVVFPFPIGHQTSLRFTIDRNPDEKRRIKREQSQAFLVYKYGSTEGNGISEVPRINNFRKALDARTQAYAKTTEFINYNLLQQKRGINSLEVTSLSTDALPPPQGIGLDKWNSMMTKSQINFIESPLVAPHRLEGPAGTGKTLSLVLKAIYLLHKNKNDDNDYRSIFVTHSQATKIGIINLFAINSGDEFVINNHYKTNSKQSIEVTTLHELCSKILKKEISESELVDKDALESKLMQKLYSLEAVNKTIDNELNSHKPVMSDNFINFIEKTDRCAISEMVQHEISVQIKGRAEQDFGKYKKLPVLKFGIPVENDGDRAFVFLMYGEYQKELETVAQFDTDDVVLSAISQLDTPIWRRRRVREGYNTIFIDETHLFNLNELSIFHKLTKYETSQPIAYSVDRSQALGDRGWTSEAFDNAFDPNNAFSTKENTYVKSIFRCSSDIIDLAFSVTSSGANLFTNFHNPLTDAVSAFSAYDEKKCKKPLFIYYASDDEMYNDSFSRAELMYKEIECHKSDVAIIVFGDESFEMMKCISKKYNKPIEILKNRGDISAVNNARRGGKYIISSPEFVGGLEFRV
jgi:hypothetical protein